MESIRQRKINQLIKTDLAAIFQSNDGQYFPGQMVSVTDVQVSPDLGIARVALSLFPEKDPKDFKVQVTEYSKEIRFLLGKKAGKQLRIIPELIYYLDDSLGRMEAINQALKL